MTTEHHIDNGEPMDTVGRLLKLAGEPDPIPAERTERVRGAVEDAWQRQVDRRRRTWMGGLAIAASLVAVAGLALFQFTPSPGAPPALLARTVGTVVVDGIESAAGASLDTGQRVATAADGRASLTWSTGHSLRMDVATRVTITGAGRLDLLEGRIYVDSGTDPRHREALVIDTDFGPVRDIGTQFLVAARGDELSVRVREGIVEVAPEGGETLSVEAGYGLRLADNGAARKEAVETRGEEWDWAFEAAPTFELEGRSLDEFLRWISRENGWTLEYADLRTRRTAEDSSLHGSIEGLNARQALDSVLRTFGFGFRLDSGILRVGQESGRS